MRYLVRVLAILFAITFSSEMGVPQIPDDTPIRVNTVLLNLPVAVSDERGKRISGLTKEKFTVFQDNESLPIEYFIDTSGPMSVLLLLDTSGSTSLDIENIRKSARRFIDRLSPGDQGAVMTFDYAVSTKMGLTSDLKKLRTSVDRVQTTTIPIEEAPRGESGYLFDAIQKAVEKELADQKGRKAIIVLTDGFEYGTRVSFDKVSTSLSEIDVPIYSIIFPSPGASKFFPPNTKRMSRDQYLKIIGAKSIVTLVEASGGAIYLAPLDDLESAFDTIGDEMRRQYVIGFYPKVSGGSVNGTISIGVDVPGALVRTRRNVRVRIQN